MEEINSPVSFFYFVRFRTLLFEDYPLLVSDDDKGSCFITETSN